MESIKISHKEEMSPEEQFLDLVKAKRTAIDNIVSCSSFIIFYAQKFIAIDPVKEDAELETYYLCNSMFTKKEHVTQTIKNMKAILKQLEKKEKELNGNNVKKG